MGNEKRLFLLAVMTVIMSTAGYGTLYPDQNNETEVNKDEIIKQEMLTDNHKKSNTVISVGAGKYAVIDKEVNLELINTNKNVNKKIINITGDGTDSNGKKIETINNGNIVGINNGGKGFEIISMQGGNFKNEGLISISGKDSKGITLTGGKAIAINGLNGNMEIKNEAIGVVLANNKTSFKNQGIMTVINGTGVQFDKTGTADAIFINSGTLNAGNGIAVQNIGKGNTTTYLKNGSTVSGKIIGSSTGGTDILALEGGEKKYSNLDISNYGAITVRNGKVEISNSNIGLYYNKKTKDYLEKAKEEINKIDEVSTNGNLTISNSNLSINLNGNPNKIVDADSLTFDGNISLKFSGTDKEYNVNDILGIDNIDITNANFIKTVIWDYKKNDENDLIARKKDYSEIIYKSQLNEFSKVFQDPAGELYKKVGNVLEDLRTEEEFNTAMTQLSGGLHGYTVDIAAVNARTLSNTMKERALTRDYLIKRPVSSWTQDIMYIDNNHRFGGLMDVEYNETGAMGVSEKQILSNGRVGLVYGGSSGKADASEYGNIDVDTAYFGGYYNHEFNDKWSLNSNANFVYTHNKVTRNVNFGEVNHTFKSNYPTYTVGVGSSLIYTVKDDLYNKAHFYAGIDVNRIMQGMITEEEDKKYGDASNLAIRKSGTSPNDKSYYSIVPSAGFMVQNTGYIFDRKYRIGADLNWETEVGNIKDGKRLNMKGISSEYKVETTERENVFSYSLFGALNLTEDLAVNAKYTSMFSDEYDADMVSAGFEYKMDTMGDNGIFGPIFYGLENHKPMSDRWAGTFSLMLENEDATDRTYYTTDGKLVGGDYATSNEYKPKFTLSLNDKKSDWSYYFEGYYKSNDFIKNPKENEESSHATRIHGEARWTDTYSKGKYGINIGYRNETSNKPKFSNYKYARRTQRGVHQLRLTPNFTYELGNGFTFTGKTTGIFEYNYTGLKEGQMDFLMENEYGIIYTGFMPRWRMSVIYFRDDRWYDNSDEKLLKYNNQGEPVTDFYAASARYQLGQIRPSVTYYFGNGASFKFDMRIPLGNGQWYSDKNGTKTGETYEVRYGFNYYHPVTPGLTMNVGGTFLNIKNKGKDHSKDTYGDVTRSYSFRPNIGFSYSF